MPQRGGTGQERSLSEQHHHGAAPGDGKRPALERHPVTRHSVLPPDEAKRLIVRSADAASFCQTACLHQRAGPTQPAEAGATLHAQVTHLFKQQHLFDQDDREQLAIDIAQEVIDSFDGTPPLPDLDTLADLVWRIFNFEEMFTLPKFDWDEPASTTEYWELIEHLREQKRQVDNFDHTRRMLVRTLCEAVHPIITNSPELPKANRGDIAIPTDLVRAISDLDQVVEGIISVLFDPEVEKAGVFKEHRRRIESNGVAASGGNPADPDSYRKPITLPTKSRIQDPYELIAAYLGGTPISDLFDGMIKISIPDQVRFEHHHIVAGSGHGKTQTLQYLIAEDLKAVETGRALRHCDRQPGRSDPQDQAARSVCARRAAA